MKVAPKEEPQAEEKKAQSTLGIVGEKKHWSMLVNEDKVGRQALMGIKNLSPPRQRGSLKKSSPRKQGELKPMKRIGMFNGQVVEMIDD